MRPEIARYLERVARSEEETIEIKVAPYRDATLEEMGLASTAVCRAVAAVLAARPDRDRVLAFRDPPHPSYATIVRRLRACVKERGSG